MYVAYSLKSVVGLLYELFLSYFIPVVNALSKLQESGMFILYTSFYFPWSDFAVDATALVFGLFAHSKESAFILKSLVTGYGGL